MKVKQFLVKQKERIFKTSCVVGTALLLPVTSAFAEEGGDVTAVTSAFTEATTSIKSVLGTVGKLGVGVMVVFLGWKYGKKIFNRVAN